MKKLLLIGGGLAHAEVLRQLAGSATANAEVTLVSPRRQVLQSGMLAGLVAGHYGHAQCHIELAKLARAAHAVLVDERVVGLDPAGNRARLAGGRVLEFDLASIEVGAAAPAPRVPGLREFALLARPVELFLEGWVRIRELMVEGTLRKLTVIGGDAAAVELLLAMRFRLARELPAAILAECGFSIVTAGARLLEAWPQPLAEAVEAECAAQGISLLRGATVVAVERDTVVLSNGARLASDITVWAEDGHPAAWLVASGLDCDAAGCMQVDQTLRSTSHPQVFGAGHCAALPERPGDAIPGRELGPVNGLTPTEPGHEAAQSHRPAALPRRSRLGIYPK